MSTQHWHQGALGTWHADLSTSFPCAGRSVYVSVAGLHWDTGRPRWDIRWSSRPDRLTAADCAQFEARKFAAVASLQARLDALSERSA